MSLVRSSCTFNSDYVSSATANLVLKMGNIVFFHTLFTVSTEAPSGTIIVTVPYKIAQRHDWSFTNLYGVGLTDAFLATNSYNIAVNGNALQAGLAKVSGFYYSTD